jgi:3-oxoacyl-[acyl-carrier protein] reductase
VAVFKVIADIQNKHKRIDALINCAGYPGPTTEFVEDIKWADYEKVMAVNLYGAIWLTQAVLPIMKSQKYGRIVQVASIAGKEGNPKMAPYNTSKSGLIGFVKGVAKEVATLGITVNALAPAVIKTPLNENTSEEMLKYMVVKIPAGRLGEVGEVAEIISFMASKACSFTTGFTFDISGGRATY